MKHQRGECEALRLLRAIVEGNSAEAVLAMGQARQLIKIFHRPGHHPHPLRKITQDQLREIAQLDAMNWPSQRIADKIGIHRRAVTYHLKPSGAMFDAMLGAPEAAA